MATHMAWHSFLLLLAVFVLSAATIAFRLYLVLNRDRPKDLRHGRPKTHGRTHLMIVLGSGGHTAEMLAMLERAVGEDDPKQQLDWHVFTHRSWVVSSGDAISAERARRFEEWVRARSKQHGSQHQKASFEIHVVPRARKIHQPLATAPWSSLKCLWACIGVLMENTTARSQERRDFPDLILCNGPATATILVFSSIILRALNIKHCDSRGKMRTIYVESWARVKKLSLSGMLLSRVVDRFLVQWPQLERAGGRTEYIGVLV